MPRVSILLTCFNHLAYLPAAVAGIQSQTFTDYEVIAIDDGSIDGTRDWLLTECPIAIRTIFNETNLGTYASLNVALAAATGEFVAVLNDDDVWAPHKLEAQVAMLDDRPELALIHTDGDFIDGAGIAVPGSPLGFSFPRFVTGDILAGLYYENKIIASAALARTAVLRELGGFDEGYFGSGDWQMWFRVALGHPIGFVDEPLTSYRVHGTNASHKLDRIWRDDEKLRVWMRESYGELAKRFPGEEANRAIAHNEACLGTIFTLNGKPAEGRAAYRKSLELLPGRLKSRLRIWTTYLPTSIFRKLL